eukprot:5555479-Amphidinium_carterae.1
MTIATSETIGLPAHFRRPNKCLDFIRFLVTGIHKIQDKKKAGIGKPRPHSGFAGVPTPPTSPLRQEQQFGELLSVFQEKNPIRGALASLAARVETNACCTADSPPLKHFDSKSYKFVAWIHHSAINSVEEAFFASKSHGIVVVGRVFTFLA